MIDGQDDLDEDEKMMMQQMGLSADILKPPPVKAKYVKESDLQQNQNQFQPPTYQDEYDDEDSDDINGNDQMKVDQKYRKTTLPSQVKQNQKNIQKQAQVDQEMDYEDEDDDEEGEEEEMDPEVKITQLLQSINGDPYDFANYQQLIELYRQNGLLEELREVRERVHQLYCLPVEMWLEWIDDEQRALTPEESPEKILNLCEQSIKEYRYYKVCKKYCKLLIQLFELQQGKVTVQSVRDGFEKVLQIWGLDVNRSVKFWEPYLDFEKAQMNQMLSRSSNSEQDQSSQVAIQEEINQQTGRIRSIYRRRVIFPTMDMFVMWSEYEQWETDENELQRQKERYLQANERINLVVNFEENFQHAYQDLENNNDIEQMTKLLQKDLENLAQENFNYIMLYFERILSEYTLNLDLWRLYLNYTDEKCKTKQLKQDIYEKAVKNCPQEYEIWLGYLRELEKNEVQADQIITVANQALSNGAFEVSIQFQYEIFKFLCEYQVRQLIVQPGGAKPNLENAVVQQQVNQIRAMYKDAIENIKEQNQSHEFLQFFTEKLLMGWAEVEAYKIQDKKQVSELMEEYVKGNGHLMISWANYIKMMRVFPDHEKSLRGLFKRGLQFTKDSKIVLAELWLEWEKKFTNIQNVDQCIKHLKKLNIYSHIGKPVQQTQQIQQQQQQISVQDNQIREKGKKQADKYQNDYSDQIKDQRNKRENNGKYGNSEIQIEPKSKRQKIDQQEEPTRKNKNQQYDEERQSKKSQEKPLISSEEQRENVKRNKRTLFLSELSNQVEEEDIQDLFTRVVPEVKMLDIRLIRDDQGQKKGYAYVDVETYEMAEKSLKLNNYNLKGSILKIHIYKPPEGENIERTVYVNNLPFTCDERKLEDHFKQVGMIKEIRLKRELNGRIKGFAYVEFTDKFSVKKAVAELDKSKLEGRTISVEFCKTKDEARNKYGFTVHFKNLDYKLTDDVMRQYFEEHFGEVKRMSITKDDKGHSLGFGYVEFVEEESLKKAVAQKEIRDLGKRIIIMQRSLRQITQPNNRDVNQDHAAKQKKRDTKQERKTLLSSMINEIKNEELGHLEAKTVVIQSATETKQNQQDIKVDQQVNIQTNLQQQDQSAKNKNQNAKESNESQVEMSNSDFKKFLLSKRR